jgi:phage-related minor tail protein
MRDATTSAKSSIDTLSRIANTIEEASKAIQETSKENSESVSELAELVSTTVEEGNNMLASLKNTWETQEKVLSGADDALASSFKQITENLESSLGRLSEFSQSSSDQFSEIVNGLMGMVDALQETVEDLQSPSGR